MPAARGPHDGLPPVEPVTTRRVTCRLAGNDPVDPLSATDEAQLLDWDAEKYRQSLDQRVP